MRHIKLLIALLFLPLTLSAQFFVTGDDPGKLKWNYIDTESYRIIYPQGADSLARVYGRKLEKYKIPVSRTSGYITGEGDGKIMPVVIHAFNDANGSVAWAPKRMDMFAVPSAYDPEPMPWSTMLSVHESRHVTQMQFGMTEKHKPGKWFLGQGWNILAFLLYPGTSKTEGDAVVAETALTPSGRGRTADFLNYFWVALDQGDTRKWFQWRYVSQLNYSPTYYALGYLTIGGFRYIYDYPYFVSEALHNVAAHPAKLGCLYNISKKVTGMEWEGMWKEVRDSMYGIWKADAEKRAPYISSERILSEPSRYTDYTDLLIVGEDLYAIKEGHVHTPSLVRIDKDGNEFHETLFPHTASAPKWDEKKGRIYWSETIQDERWTLKSDSKVRYLDSGKKKTLKNKAMLHNPSAKGNMIATVEYRMDGHSYLDIIDSDRGNTLIEVNAPDTLQLVETAWLGGKVYVTAISDNGYGIYTVDPDDGIWDRILGPQPVMVKDFKTYGSELIFACDRTGVNELYHLNPTTGELRQKTSTRYGAADFTYSTDGSQLYYSSQTLKGKHIFRTSTDSLINRSVRFDSLYRYPLAERLKEQETAAAKAQGYAAAVTVKDEDVQISEPERYRKVPNMLNLHTWFPAYVSVDNIMNMSFDKVYQALSLGVSGVTQNHLATAVGEAGYSAHKDPYNPARWRHSGHAKFTYSGLYPVFEFSFDINDRSARQYFNHGNARNGEIYMVNTNELAAPYVQGKVSMYIPFNLSSGGWHKGVIPRISYTITNDRFNTGTAYIEKGINGPQTMGNSFVYYKEGRNVLRQYLGGSVRAYATTGIANSQVYPRWGIGGETGVSAGLEGCEVFSPVGYLYGYGYVPGIIRTQGLKLTAMWQRKLVGSSAFCQQTVDFLPRGLSSIPSLGSYLSIYNRDLFKITADYAIPIFIGDVTIGGNILAIKRLVLYPHYDHTFIGKNGLWSAGIDVTADLQAIATIEWPCSVGLSFCWNGGSAWDSIPNEISMKKWFLGPVFNVSF